MSRFLITNAVRTACTIDTSETVVRRYLTLRLAYTARPEQLAERLSQGTADALNLTASCTLSGGHIEPCIDVSLRRLFSVSRWTLQAAEAAIIANVLTAQNRTPASLKAAEALRRAVTDAEALVAGIHQRQQPMIGAA